MSDLVLIGLGLIISLGILLQWIAKIIKIPGIILLLPAGIIVGPVLGLVNPNEIFGNLLFPLVTIGVGLLLLKGGFELKIRMIQPDVKKAIGRLISVGILITLAIGAFSAFILFKIPPIFAFLMAAVLVVSGPTVVGPILNIARPKESVGHILLWEGITIDPIGASLGVAVISFITSQNNDPILDMFLTAVLGLVIGLFAAIFYVLGERSGRIPPNLNPLVALMFAITAIVWAEVIFSEAGLFAALAMGLFLGNQKITPAVGVKEFTETLEPLIISILFIMLAAMLNLQALKQYLIPALILVAIYVFLVRPLVAFISTYGLGFSFKERLFIGAMAPKGIVAASTSSLFVISLSNIGVSFPQLVPVVFTVIIASVMIYSLSAPLLSRRLNLSLPGRNAVALVGDEPWVWDLAETLNQAGAGVMQISHGKNDICNFITREKVPYMVYSGFIAELSVDEIPDDAHDFVNLIQWLIIATSDPNIIKIAEETFTQVIGHNNIIIFGRSRQKQDKQIFGGLNVIDILSNTPFGLFGKNEDELLDMLDSGGSFEIQRHDENLSEDLLSGVKRAFLRVKSDGALSVPGTLEPLGEGESFIIVTPKNYS